MLRTEPGSGCGPCPPQGFQHQGRCDCGCIFQAAHPSVYPPRVNLTIWGEAYDWFQAGAAANATRGLKGASRGGKVGEIFVSTDIQALRQEKHYIDLMVRAALKSAAGDFSQYI